MLSQAINFFDTIPTRNTWKEKKAFVKLCQQLYAVVMIPVGSIFDLVLLNLIKFALLIRLNKAF